MTESITPAALALRLHETGTQSLRGDVPPNTVVTGASQPATFTVTGSVIEFTSLAERNRLVAETNFAEIRERHACDPNEVYEQARRLWRQEIGHPDKASGRLLALAAKELDIVAIGTGRIRRGEDVFSILHLLEAALPHMEALELGSLIDLCVAKHESTKNDHAGGMFHSALEAWLADRPLCAGDLRLRVLSSLSEPTANLLCNSVIALSKSDFAQAVALAKADAGDKAPLRAGVGAWALGRLLREGQASPALQAEIAGALTRLIESGAGELRQQAISAVTGSLHVSRLFDTLLKQLAATGDQLVLTGIANTLFLRDSEMVQREDLTEWLDLLTGLSPDSKWGVSNLDHALARLMTDARFAPLVPPALTKWTARHGHRSAMDKTVSEHFASTCEKLASNGDAWSRLLTDWLLSDDRAHAANLAGVMSMLSHVESLQHRLDKPRVEALEPAGLLFLARRLLGYVHDRRQVTALAMSMLAVDSPRDRILPVLRALLVDEIGYDHPGSTIEACKAAAADAPRETQTFLLSVADSIEKSLDAVQGLPRRKEFRPPERLRREFSRARTKQMNQAFEEASKKSIWRHLATEIHIKAGRGTFQYQNETYGQTMRLGSITHSVEMPRREVFDPVGNAIRLLGFRVAKRGEQ